MGQILSSDKSGYSSRINLRPHDFEVLADLQAQNCQRRVRGSLAELSFLCLTSAHIVDHVIGLSAEYNDLVMEVN